MKKGKIIGIAVTCLLILSTCEYTYKNGRFVVVAKKVG